MTFNDRARLDPSKVKRRKTAAGVGIGGGVGVIAVFLLSQFLGVDLSGLVGGGAPGGTTQDQGQALEECQTGEDANSNIDCRMVGAATSLDDYWAEEAPALGVTDYFTPDFYLFEQATSTGCGNATSAVGPFYCPTDTAIYLDTGFYADLRDKYGSSGGPLAQLYVVAHEWGHHIQNLTGVLASENSGDTGPASASVRTELQADCYAGSWVGAASTIEDADGTTFLEPVTDAQIADALNAASVIGDDRIQEKSSGQVNPEAWTHGSSESRQKWFSAGLSGGPTACDTFGVDASQL